MGSAHCEAPARDHVPHPCRPSIPKSVETSWMKEGSESRGQKDSGNEWAFSSPVHPPTPVCPSYHPHSPTYTHTHSSCCSHYSLTPECRAEVSLGPPERMGSPWPPKCSGVMGCPIPTCPTPVVLPEAVRASPWPEPPPTAGPTHEVSPPARGTDVGPRMLVLPSLTPHLHLRSFSGL